MSDFATILGLIVLAGAIVLIVEDIAAIKEIDDQEDSLNYEVKQHGQKRNI